MMISTPKHGLRIGIITDGLEERVFDGETRIANGGVGVYIYQLIRHLLEVDQANQFFLIRYGQGQLDIYRHPRVRAIFLPAGKMKIFRIAFSLSHRRVAHELGLDLLHYPNQFGGAFLPRSIRRVATLHDLTPLLFPTMHPRARVLAYKLMARISLRRANCIIVDSDNTGRDLMAFRMARGGNIITISPGVGAGFSPGNVEPSFLAQRGLGRAYILTVGVLEPRKNHLLLLEVLERLNRSGHDLELVIIGREGWRWTDPLVRPEFKALKSHVRVLKDISEQEMVEYYRHAAVFAYPSLYEGFGLPVLEAMACGTPVVCSNTSSLPEVGGGAVLYADPGDPDAFAAQVSKVLCDSDLKKKMIIEGIERARRFSWRGTAAATLRVYQSVCESNHLLPHPNQPLSATA